MPTLPGETRQGSKKIQPGFCLLAKRNTSSWEGCSGAGLAGWEEREDEDDGKKEQRRPHLDSLLPLLLGIVEVEGWMVGGAISSVNKAETSVRLDLKVFPVCRIDSADLFHAVLKADILNRVQWTPFLTDCVTNQYFCRFDEHMFLVCVTGVLCPPSTFYHDGGLMSIMMIHCMMSRVYCLPESPDSNMMGRDQSPPPVDTAIYLNTMWWKYFHPISIHSFTKIQISTDKKRIRTVNCRTVTCSFRTSSFFSHKYENKTNLRLPENEVFACKILPLNEA